MKDVVQKRGLNEKNFEVLNKIVSDIKYGTVTLVIQDGVLIQIDKNEKIRLK